MLQLFCFPTQDESELGLGKHLPEQMLAFGRLGFLTACHCFYCRSLSLLLFLLYNIYLFTREIAKYRVKVRGLGIILL